MGSRLRVFLTPEQDKTLFNIRTADVPQKVKDRAEVIRLSAHGWYVEKIAVHFNWTAQTVREVLHKWGKLGVEGLWVCYEDCKHPNVSLFLSTIHHVAFSDLHQLLDVDQTLYH